MTQQRRKTASKEVPPDELENARWGYQAAISSSISYSNTFWSIFNAMLVANSFVIGAITSSSISQFASLDKYLSVAGFVVCLIWGLLSKRHQEYVEYYLLSAREIEERYFLKSVKTYSRGGDFAEGKSVVLEIGQSKQQQQLSFLARWTGGKLGKWAPYIVIVVFAGIYILIFSYAKAPQP